MHRGKMEQILLAYGLPKETVAAIMMQYKNTKVKVCSPDWDTDYFDIVAGVLQGDILAPYLFIICLDYVLRTFIILKKENNFKLAKESSRRYSAQTITDVDYADDIALLANSTAQAESLLHGTSSRWHRLPCKCRPNRIHMLYLKWQHFHTKGWSSETSGQFHLAWKQRLINQEWHQHATSKGMDSYR